MLGWALKSGLQGVTGIRDEAPDSEAPGDITQFDGPDTPAPVFAARAIKNVLWGQTTEPTHPAPVPDETVPSKTSQLGSAAAVPKSSSAQNMSPTKPNSILLTPGTGTSRRKKVSFGQDVKAGNNVDSSPLAANSMGNGNGKQRKKTTLQEALENSRSTKTSQLRSEAKTTANWYHPEPEYDSDGEPGERDEADDTEEYFCNHDLTTDLNEPFSESGKYWKAEFSRYRDEAKVDIEQLVKYKANAKSFAAKKDAEASQLAQRLKESDEIISALEEKMKRLATGGGGSKNETQFANLTRSLERQTALTEDYREQVKDLKSQLEKALDDNCFASLSTPKALTDAEDRIMELTRELRKARSDLRLLDKLRGEVGQLKSDLATSQKQMIMLECEKNSGAHMHATRLQKLETQLHQINEESRQKDSLLRKLKRENESLFVEVKDKSNEASETLEALQALEEESRQKDATIRKLKREIESLKDDARLKSKEVSEVKEEKNSLIGVLEAKIRSLEADKASSNQSTNLDVPSSQQNKVTQVLRSGIESLRRGSRYESAKPVNRRLREAKSVEDMDLDMTTRSLRLDAGNPVLTERHRRPVVWSASEPSQKTDNDLLGSNEPKMGPAAQRAQLRLKGTTDQTTDNFDFDVRGKAYGIEPEKGSTQEMKGFKQVSDVTQPSKRKVRHRPSDDVVVNRPISDVLTDRVNEASRRERHKHEKISSREPLYMDEDQKRVENKDTGKRTVDLSRTRAAMAGGYNQNTRAQRDAMAPVSEAARVDLVEDRYSRVGAPLTDQTAVGNTSRCALPADRQAAARARLEQKKLERQKANDRPRHKENLRT